MSALTWIVTPQTGVGAVAVAVVVWAWRRLCRSPGARKIVASALQAALTSAVSEALAPQVVAAIHDSEDRLGRRIDDLAREQARIDRRLTEHLDAEEGWQAADSDERVRRQAEFDAVLAGLACRLDTLEAQ